ncbi:DUF5067 domain-containing protein [Fructilactobacillus myrtifloralis]|uniref:DUF5067 domain-containing protein n=1 Tax=Fructilactobacillus myrtifloralis TaxID=2940301 RepID=A0ABY5BP69_9LACO|nr:DUF5067 domain-containing protein [Fructilactobacillus myrtifloralis]USS85468.1 DUF5067 domain-containing protein [Fructilactobacillus myrtifloralis]
MKKKIILGMVTICTLGLAGCSTPGHHADNAKSKSAPTSQTTQPSFRNNVAQLNDKTIRIKGVKTIKQPNETEPSMVAFIYQVTNKSKRVLTPKQAWNENMKVSQNKQELKETNFSDKTLPQNSDQTIAKGQTVKSAVVYQLQSPKESISINASQGINSNPIDQNANQQIDGTDLGTQTFAINK